MDKTVLITGASRGIGRACAMLFAQNGYNVVINYNSSKKAALELGDNFTKSGYPHLICKANVSVFEEVENMVNKALKEFKKIDVLINNAGIAEQKLFTDITPNDFQRMLNVNVGGVFNCCKCVVPGMISRKSGNIINISSMWGQVGASCEVHYSASKAAIIGFTKALAKELGPSSINVNCIAPGVIDTDMNMNLSKEDILALKDETPLEAIGTPMDIAKSALFLASENASFITGQVLGVNGGFII